MSHSKNKILSNIDLEGNSIYNVSVIEGMDYENMSGDLTIKTTDTTVSTTPSRNVLIRGGVVSSTPSNGSGSGYVHIFAGSTVETVGSTDLGIKVLPNNTVEIKDSTISICATTVDISTTNTTISALNKIHVISRDLQIGSTNTTVSSTKATIQVTTLNEYIGLNSTSDSNAISVTSSSTGATISTSSCTDINIDHVSIKSATVSSTLDLDKVNISGDITLDGTNNIISSNNNNSLTIKSDKFTLSDTTGGFKFIETSEASSTISSNNLNVSTTSTSISSNNLNIISTSTSIVSNNLNVSTTCIHEYIGLNATENSNAISVVSSSTGATISTSSCTDVNIDHVSVTNSTISNLDLDIVSISGTITLDGTNSIVAGNQEKSINIKSDKFTLSTTSGNFNFIETSSTSSTISTDIVNIKNKISVHPTTNSTNPNILISTEGINSKVSTTISTTTGIPLKVSSSDTTNSKIALDSNGSIRTNESVVLTDASTPTRGINMYYDTNSNSVVFSIVYDGKSHIH